MNTVEALDQLTREWGYPRQFAWGSSDCAQLTNRACELITGVSKLVDWPTYSTALGAKRALSRRNFHHLNDAFDFYLTRLPDGTIPQAGDIFSVTGNSDGPWDATCISYGGWRGLTCVSGQGYIVIDIAPEFRSGAVWGLV